MLNSPTGELLTHATLHPDSEDDRLGVAWSGIVGLREGDRYLIVNPFFHAFGYKAGWLSCILRGATNRVTPL